MGMSKNHFDKDFETEKYGSSLVGACNFDISEPTYDIDHLVTFQEGILNPWSSSWTSNIE